MSASNHTKRIIDSLKDDHDDEPDKKKIPIGGEIELVDEIELIDDDVPVQSNIDECSVIEKNVGICEYVNPDVYGVFGIVKQRLSDFQVHEIEPSANRVVYLNNFDLPLTKQACKPEVDPNLPDKVKFLIGDEKYNEFNEFLNNSDTNQKFFLNAPKEKSDKKMFHDFIREFHSDYISNTTTDCKYEQIIEVLHKEFKGVESTTAFKRGYKSNRMEHDYCQCVLYKENIDTIQAVGVIAKNLRIKCSRINYAGTKDKRAKTSQILSFYKVKPEDLLKLNEKFNIMKLGNFSLTNDQLKLGDLNGNRFSIVLRQMICKDDELIVKCVESLAKNGFINYYGLQRFGTSSIPTHEIGLQLLLNKYKEAIELILKPRKDFNEKEELSRARDIWEKEHNAGKAFEQIRRLNCVEKYLLNGLSECMENDYLGAFSYIPRNMRLMYVHAYQSYVWNVIASERVRSYGLKPMVGDLVYDKQKNVVVLNDANIISYTIEDVLLPLPGYSITYPNNQIQELYKTMLEKDNLKIDNMKNKVKDLSLPGDYRHLIVKPKNVEYKIINHNDNKTDLVSSDWDKINGMIVANENLDPATEAQYKSLIIEFNLPSASYATMALRELTKLNSSKFYQSSLNK